MLQRPQTLVQYGGGHVAVPGWINFDCSPVLRLERMPVIGSIWPRKFDRAVRYGDVCKRLPLEAGAADAVFCSHVLEHLALEDCRSALRETFRILRPGGIFRGVMPDLEFAVRRYLNNPDAGGACQLVGGTYLGTVARPRSIMAIAREYFGSSKHLWLWDYKGFRHELEQAGFIEIRRAFFNDSDMPAFKDIEIETRWRSHHLGFECRRPEVPRRGRSQVGLT